MSERYSANPNELNPTADLPHCGRYFVARGFIDKGETVIDAACGHGYGSAILAEVAEQVFALDKDDVFLSQWNRENVTFFQTDLDEVDFETFVLSDTVVCLETIEHLKDPEKFLDRVTKVADKKIIISSPNKATAGLNEFHLHDVQLPVLEKMMDKYPEWKLYQTFLQGYYYIAVYVKEGTKLIK